MDYETRLLFLFSVAVFVNMVLVFSNTGVVSGDFGDPVSSICGNRQCELGESSSCPQDCCGDGFCHGAEPMFCPQDCQYDVPGFCGDGKCADIEKCVSASYCPADCGRCTLNEWKERNCWVYQCPNECRQLCGSRGVVSVFCTFRDDTSPANNDVCHASCHCGTQDLFRASLGSGGLNRNLYNIEIKGP